MGTVPLAAAAALTALAPPAGATQEYAKREGKECSHCHVNEKGGGPRNANGREYEANGHVFGAKSWSSDGNRAKYLRACSALLATWYGEAARLLDELAKEEELPGGTALLGAARERYRMFPRTWLRSAKTLLGKGERGLPNAYQFCARLESQFPATDEGKEAIALLDAAAKDEEKAPLAAEARVAEKVRMLVLRGRTEWDQGNAEAARKLFDEALADPRGESYAKEIDDLLAGRHGG